MRELGENEGCDREAFASWDCGRLTVLEDRNGPEQVGIEVDNVGKTFLNKFGNVGKRDWASEIALRGTKLRPQWSNNNGMQNMNTPSTPPVQTSPTPNIP